MRLARDQVRSLLVIVIAGLAVIWPLFNFQSGLMGVDAQVEGAWVRYLVDSLEHYNVLPTWSPLWLYGMEFPGTVPPFFLVLPSLLTFITHNEFTALNIVGILSFIGAGISMYYLVRYLAGQSNLVATISGVLYMLLPMHIEQVGHGQVSVIFSYALLPLVGLALALLCTQGKVKYAVALGLLAGVMALGQPELFYISTLFFFTPLGLVLLFQQPRQARWQRLGMVGLSLAIFALITARYVLTVLGATEDIGFPDEQLQTISYYSYGTIHDLFRIPDPVNDYGVRDLGYDAQHGVVAVLLTAAALTIAAVFSSAARRRPRWVLLGVVTLIVTLGFTLAFGPRTVVFDWVHNLPLLGELRVAYRFYILVALGVPLIFALSYHHLNSVLARRVFLFAAVIMSLFAFRPYFTGIYPRLMYDDNNNKRVQLSEYLTSTNPSGSYRLLDYPCILNKDYLASIEPGKRVELTCSSLYWSQSFRNREYSDLLYRALLSDNPALLDQFTRLYNVDYFLAAELHRPDDRIPRLATAKFGHAEAKDFFIKEYGSLAQEAEVLSNREGDLTVYKLPSSEEADIRFFPLEGQNQLNLFIYEKPLDMFVWLLKISSNQGFPGIDFNQTLFVEASDWARNGLGGELNNWRVAVYDDGTAQELLRDIPQRNETVTPDKYEVRPDGIKLDLTTPGPGIVVLPYFFQRHWRAETNDGQPLKTLPVQGRQLGIAVPGGQQTISIEMK